MNPVYEKIVDGLADHGYAIADHFLSLDEVRDVLATDAFKEELLHFRKAGIGQEKIINEEIRGDYIQWLDLHQPDPAMTVYVNRLKELVTQINRNLFLSLKDIEAHLTIYPPGSYYHRHLDRFQTHDHRKLSVICYLNETWTEADGGQLRLFLEEPLDILPVAGRMVCFRSDSIEHEVLPGSKNRMSITGWILDQFADLRHL
jgi:SM-20-related protein